MNEYAQVTKIPNSMTQTHFPYCPGCSHGLIHRLVAEVIDELAIGGKTVGITSAGCSVRSWRQFDSDMVMALHGRGPAVATVLKRARPESIVFTYQGDGDMTAIGTGEIIHAASRCERITVIFVNNGVFGATGGQQAPTTLLGQATTSYPEGRDPKTSGYPLKMAELLSMVAPDAYIARTSVHNIKHILKTKKAIQKAFLVQTEDRGFGLVEILAACPTAWRLNPAKCLERIESEIIPHYPLKAFSSPEKET
ncbi:thiamine pyrophosphate-dependent enzyme [Desulfobacterales bacterium]|nr:thiamine pyrophosphate-dependent enzyme [Desulfobacterales bacterium]